MATFRWAYSPYPNTDGQAWIDQTDPAQTGIAVPGTADTIVFPVAGEADLYFGTDVAEADVEAATNLVIEQSAFTAQMLRLDAAATLNGDYGTFTFGGLTGAGAALSIETSIVTFGTVALTIGSGDPLTTLTIDQSDFTAGAITLGSAGTITVSGGGTFNTGNVSIGSDAALEFDSEGTIGDLMLQGSGRIDFTGVADRLTAGAVTISGSGGFTLASQGTLTAAAVTVTGPGGIVGTAGGGIGADLITDDLLIDQGGSITLDSGGATVRAGKTLTVGGSGAGALSLAMFSADTVTIGQSSGATGSVTVDDVGDYHPVSTVSGVLTIGDQGTGTLAMTGASVTAGTIVVGEAKGSTGRFSIDQTGITRGSLGNVIGGAARLVVGEAGSGSFSLTGGASFTISTAAGTGSLVIGDAAGGVGSVTFDGGNRGLHNFATGEPGDLVVYGALTIGNAGNGTLLVRNQGLVEAFDAAAALAAGTTVVPYAPVDVGVTGTGTLMLDSGSVLDASVLTLGRSAGAVGDVVLDSGADPANGTPVTAANTPMLNVSGTLVVGVGGTGTLELRGGAQATIAGTVLTNDGEPFATNGTAVIGDQSGSVGRVTLAGFDDASSEMLVDQTGTTVAEGNDPVIPVGLTALTDYGGLTVGNAGSGRLDVRGAAAALALGSISIGVTGSGTVDVSAGAGVFGQSIDAGVSAEATGAILVDAETGGGTTFTNIMTNALTIGDAGTGSLTEQGDGAMVQAGSIIALAAKAGSTATVVLGINGEESQGDELACLGLDPAHPDSLSIGGTAGAAGGSATVTINDNGSLFTATDAIIWSAGAVVLDGTREAQFTVAGTLTVKRGASIGGHGSIDTLANMSGVAGQTTEASAIVTDADIVAQGGTLDIGDAPISGAGSLVIDAGATLVLHEENATHDGSIANDIVFESLPGAETLSLDDISVVDGTIRGFSVGDTIILMKPGAVVTNALFDVAAQRLDIYAGATLLANPLLTGPYAQGDFRVTALDNGTNGVAVTLACFAEGTRIRTSHGDVPVEALRVGDIAALHDGRTAPIRWIGTRAVTCAGLARPELFWPVRIAAHAFADGQPERDLMLSPDHAVFIDGVLIPVRLLVNGVSIAPAPVPRVRYFHVDLPEHDVLLAEGLPVESYLDTGNRHVFANAGRFAPLPPGAVPRLWHAAACAPLVVAGPKLRAASLKLAARLGLCGYAMPRSSGEPGSSRWDFDRADAKGMDGRDQRDHDEIGRRR